MEKLTTEKEALESSLAQNYSKEESDKLQKVQKKLDEAEQVWIRAAEELGALEA